MMKLLLAMLKKVGMSVLPMINAGRFVQMYGVVVIGDHAENDELLDPFEKIISDTKKSAGMHNDTE